MLVLGVDPGSRVTGFGLVRTEANKVRCLDYGAIRLAGSGSPPPFPARLETIFQRLNEIIREHSPDAMVVESVFHAANVKSALTLGHVRGVLLLVAQLNGLELVEFSPLEVKKSVVGYGRADKQQVQAMVKTLLGLRELPQPHDAADALALALCHTFSGGLGRRKQRRWRSVDLPASK